MEEKRVVWSLRKGLAVEIEGKTGWGVQAVDTTVGMYLQEMRQ